MNLQISFYSIMMAVIWSSIGTLFLLWARKNTGLLIRLSIMPIFIFLISSVLRCILPLDFPGFTESISSSNVFVMIDKALYTSVFDQGEHGVEITMLTVFVIVWVVVSCALTTLFFVHYAKARNLDPHLYEELFRGPVYDKTVEIRNKLSWTGKGRVRVFMDESIPVPSVCGFLYPRIMLPAREYTETELHYILYHELMHWHNGDMWVKLLTFLSCYVFWWNPFIYLLFPYLGHMLELKCDISILVKVALTEEDRLDYLQVIHDACKQERDRKRALLKLIEVSSGLTGSDRDENIRQRMNVILKYKQHKGRELLASIITVIIMGAVMVFSYRYIIQPYFTVPPEEFVETTAAGTGTGELSAANGYLVQEEDGSYSLYVNGKYFCPVTSDIEKFIDSGFQVKSGTNEENP